MPGRIRRTLKNTSLAGKTAIITGGNKGLGFEVARQFLLLKVSRLIITTRDEAKGRAAVAALSSDPEVVAAWAQEDNSLNIEYYLLEIEDYKSGLLFIQKVTENVLELDFLVLNAGVNIFEYQTSISGHEKVMQVNCYTHFLLVIHLSVLMRKSSKRINTPGHITLVGSFSHEQHTFEEIPIAANQRILDYYDDKSNFRRFRRYQDSKFVINAFVQQMASMLLPNEVILNNVCPGVIETSINQNMPLWAKPFMWVYTKRYKRPLLEGARLIVKAAVAVGQESHGLFLQKGVMGRGAPFLDREVGRDFRRRLWREVVIDLLCADSRLGIERLLRNHLMMERGEWE